MLLRAILIGMAVSFSSQAQASGMKGDERKKFMSECLKA